MLSAVCPAAGYRCIVIDGLRLNLFIGVLEAERRARQEVAISMYLMVRDCGPSRSDRLADHVSYAEVVDQLKERARSPRHTNLVETLAEEAAEMALADGRVESVIVDVRKTAIIPEAQGGVGVVIHRQRATAPAPR